MERETTEPHSEQQGRRLTVRRVMGLDEAVSELRRCVRAQCDPGRDPLSAQRYANLIGVDAWWLERWCKGSPHAANNIEQVIRLAAYYGVQIDMAGLRRLL